MSVSDPYAQWDGAYVLGALSAAQRREFEQHLSDCQECTRQVAGLSGLPSMLSLTRDDATVSPVAAISPTPFYAELAAKVASRRRRFILAASVAALALVGTTAAITTAFEPRAAPLASAVSSATSSIELAFTGTNALGLTATGTLSSYPWGTQISWRCSYAATSSYGDGQPSQEYVMVLVNSSGKETTVGSWAASPGSVVTPTAATAVRASDIARLEIRVPSGAVLLSAAPQ